MLKWIVLVMFGCLAGCGGGPDRPDLVPAKGKVLLDGQPLPDADVSFQMIDPPADFKRPAIGKTNATGEFTMNTFGDVEGIPVGKYRVAVVKKEVHGANPEDVNWETQTVNGKPLKYKWVTPRVYGDVATSELTVEVTSSGMQPAEIKLDSGGSPPEIETVGRRSANEP